MRWLDNITDSMDMNLSNLRKIVKDRGSLACYSPWGYKELDMIVTEQKLKKELRSKEIHLCILLFIFIYFLHHFHKGFAATCYIYMAPHSSPLAWRIPWTQEPSRLQSVGSLRVRHDWANSLSLFTFMHWRRKWQPTPVFLPGESQGRGSLVGCHLWGHTESDTTEVI